MIKNAGVLAHWALLVEGLHTSALDFYSSVETALAERQVPEVELTRVQWAEGGIASARREYLRVRRGKLVVDICAAPYGSGSFFSWWLARQGQRYRALWALGLMFSLSVIVGGTWNSSATFSLFFTKLISFGVLFILVLAGMGSDREMEDRVLDTPYIGGLYRRLFNPDTYYRADTATMFQESVRRAVNEVIAELRSAQGLRALSEAELQPRLRDLSEL